MKLEKYPANDRKKHNKKGRGLKILIFLLFLGVIGTILFLTLFSDNSFTGKVVKDLNLNNSFQISLETDVPEISLSGDYSQIVFEILVNSDVTVEGRRISFQRLVNDFEVSDFSGDIRFDGDSIKMINGRISGYVLNEGLTQDEKNRTMRLSSSSELNYESIFFDDEVYIRGLNFIGSGKITSDGQVIHLEQDSVIIRDLLGELEIRDGKMFFEGFVTNLEIKSESKKISISR